MPSEGEWAEVRVEEPTGSRLDSYLAERLALSRSRVTQLIEGGHVLLNGAAPKKRAIPEAGDVVGPLGSERDLTLHVEETEDRRVTLAELTTEGRKTYLEALRIVTSQERELLRALGGHETEALTQALDQLTGWDEP